MEQLAGRVAVVTGAASGIGRALAARFAAEDMALVLADVDADGLAATADASRATGTEAIDVVVDVTDAEQVEALAVAAFERFGGVHVLCNNAGVFAGGLLWERPAADFDWVLGVNVAGILHGIRAFVPRMLAAGGDGHIVNTCSVAGLFGSPYTGPYTISKFAALAATECLARDLAAVGSALGVSALCPGMVDTEIARSHRHRPDQYATDASPDAAAVEAVLAAATAAGIDPAAVADAVVDAVRTRRFLVLTSAGAAPSLRSRGEALARGELPPPADFS